MGLHVIRCEGKDACKEDPPTRLNADIDQLGTLLVCDGEKACADSLFFLDGSGPQPGPAPSSPVEQARMVYDLYMSDNIDYGCRASWSNCVPVNVEGNQGCDSSHTFCRRVWTGDSDHSEGWYNRQWNYVVNGRGDYNGDPLAESACDNAYRN